MTRLYHSFISFLYVSLLIGIGLVCKGQTGISTAKKTGSRGLPNVIVIYADDLGYGDLSCYGATNIKTRNIDRLAARGLRFTNAHATAATCTPSRYSILTGQYAWRKEGTGIAPGDAALLIPTNKVTLPGALQQQGYTTGVVGKWHLGLGPAGGPDWNGTIRPGPNEIGFNYSYILPATADRVPCVYVENGRIVNLDPNDPIKVSYKDPIGSEPTGKDHPGLLTMKPSHGHDQTIINGISRIGYMSGGKSAWWKDEELGDVITEKAVQFMEKNASQPFFLYFATHDIHVPRVPNKRFVGKSGMGPRGDAILELDWSTGEILNTLQRLKLAQNTLVILTSDNGPVVDDGYQDQAVEKLNGHTPAGKLRGGKYSAFDAGTRVPFIVAYPGKVRSGTSHAMVSQVDFLASITAFAGISLAENESGDSRNMIDTYLGKSSKSREHLIEQSLNNTLSIIKGDWKYIEPSSGPKMNRNTNIELGYDPAPQLYNLKDDLGEKKNLASLKPEKLNEMKALLAAVRAGKKVF